VTLRYPVDVPFLPRGGRSDAEIRAVLEEVGELIRTGPPERRGTAIEAMGDLLLLLGEREKALLSYDEELQHYPDRFLFAAQKVLALDPGRLALALQVAERYLSVPNPERAAAWYEAARDAAREAGREDLAGEAESGLEEASRLRAEGAAPSGDEIRRQRDRVRSLLEEARGMGGEPEGENS
jgi:hypothetical protein